MKKRNTPSTSTRKIQKRDAEDGRYFILDLNASDPNPDWLGSRFQPYSFGLKQNIRIFGTNYRAEMLAAAVYRPRPLSAGHVGSGSIQLHR